MKAIMASAISKEANGNERNNNNESENGVKAAK
jgi:hypothetical protein